jgi:hypothetical protein
LVTGKFVGDFTVPHEKIEFFVCFGPARRSGRAGKMS